MSAPGGPGGPDPDGARWFRRFRTTESAASRLVCFPHAGGSASFYFPFARALAPDIEVLAAQYPGRQDRRREPGIDDVGVLADGAAAALLPLLDDRPTALFGHSMGATVGYEVARRLERAGARPELLFASGRRAPCRHRPESVHLHDDEGLANHIRRLGGTDGELLSDPDLLRMILPGVRVDYRAIETYRHRPGTELSCSIAVLTGSDDPVVSIDEAVDWSRHTTRGHTLDVFPGGHFFLNDVRDEVVALVADRMADRLSTKETSPP
ncbi:alpha/beta fold hydrolase [Streptomyces griseus]|uniref:Alpha/beta fold hydrolase n=1 Tax=Streptomyces sp. CMC78 TaxID=3231512 RepID=A0AB33KZ02_9ACTN|nr:alpha/beta fold hydrolase [Streptomyces fimicarius]WTC91456.1 alpha/beta fold hydrolase [Streptomyces griseus]WTD65911.1 alpha/beta fold hydrolase [Streptomyces griseus]